MDEIITDTTIQDRVALGVMVMNGYSTVDANYVISGASFLLESYLSIEDTVSIF